MMAIIVRMILCHEPQVSCVIHPSDLEFGRCQGKSCDQDSFSMDENCSHPASLAVIVLNSS
jgi:hypothetical protein